MDQKAVIILFVVVAVAGLGMAAVNSLKEKIVAGVQVNITPTPTPEELSFALGAQSTPLPQKQVRQYKQFPGSMVPDELKNKKAVIETNKGKIEFEVYPEATKAASNFIFLAKDGFYDGLTFHRVEPGFVIQGGDSVGNGTGGPGYQFEDEPVTKKYTKGIVAMANSGPDTNGSQFFIMLDDHAELPPKYTIFGAVISGQNVVDNIKVGDVMKQVTIEPLR